MRSETRPRYQLHSAAQDTVTQSERATSRGRCGGNTSSVTPRTVLQIRSMGKGKGREIIHCPSESWWSLDQRGSREVVTCLGSGQIVQVDPVGFPSGLDVGCKGKRGVPPGHLTQETAKTK